MHIKCNIPPFFVSTQLMDATCSVLEPSCDAWLSDRIRVSRRFFSELSDGDRKALLRAAADDDTDSGGGVGGGTESSATPDSVLRTNSCSLGSLITLYKFTIYCPESYRGTQAE